MDLNAYLERIGYHGTPGVNLETLTALHRAHLYAIPYENLDIHLGRELSLDQQQIFDKLVTQQRGGWCYEMNGLLAWALREIGFDVTLLASAVRPQMEGDGSEGDHLILMVKLDRPYLADVGFGNGLIEPIPLEAGTYTEGFLTYQLQRDGERWFFENHTGPGFVFTLQPRTMPYFTRRCHELQTLPDSGFVRATVCYRFTDEGIVCLRGAVLTRVTEAGMREEIVDNLASYEQVLNSDFDLHLPSAEVANLWEKVWARHQVWVRENA